MDIGAYIRIVVDVISPGLLATFGATAKYVHTIITQPVTFKWLFFCGNLFVAFFVGVLIASFLDPDFRFRDGVFMLCGVAALKIFSLGEKSFETVATQIAHNIASKLGGRPNSHKYRDEDHDNR